MYKGVAARNAGRYSRQAYSGPGGFVSRQAPSPTVKEAVRSYARAREAGLITLADVPEAMRRQVRDA